MLALLQTHKVCVTCRLPLWSVPLSSSVVALCRSASALCVGQAPRCSLPMGLEARVVRVHLSARGHTEMESTARASKRIEAEQRAACLSGRCLGPSCLSPAVPRSHAVSASRPRGRRHVSLGRWVWKNAGWDRSLCGRHPTMRVSLRKALQQPQWQPQWQRRLSPLCLSTATRSLCRLRTHSHAPWR